MASRRRSSGPEPIDSLRKCPELEHPLGAVLQAKQGEAGEAQSVTGVVEQAGPSATAVPQGRQSKRLSWDISFPRAPAARQRGDSPGTGWLRRSYAIAATLSSYSVQPLLHFRRGRQGPALRVAAGPRGRWRGRGGCGNSWQRLHGPVRVHAQSRRIPPDDGRRPGVDQWSNGGADGQADASWQGARDALCAAKHAPARSDSRNAAASSAGSSAAALRALICSPPTPRVVPPVPEPSHHLEGTRCGTRRGVAPPSPLLRRTGGQAVPLEGRLRRASLGPHGVQGEKSCGLNWLPEQAPAAPTAATGR